MPEHKPAREEDAREREGLSEESASPEKSSCETSRERGPRFDAGPVIVTTSDPVVTSEAEAQGEWRTHPTSTVSVETPGVMDPVPISLSGGRTVAIEHELPSRPHPADERWNNAECGKSQHEQGNGRPSAHDQKKDDESQPHDQGKHDQKEDDHPHAQSYAIGMRTLLLAGAVALVCGVLGAFGYEGIFGSKKSESGKESGQAAVISDPSGAGQRSKKSESRSEFRGGVRFGRGDPRLHVGRGRRHA
jgi:hypothetical protein